MDQDFADLLSSTRAELDRLRDAAPEGRETDVGRGDALAGRVKAEMQPDGRLSRLVLDPSVMRMDEQMLAREIVTAVNAAWAARLGADPEVASVAAIDPDALRERLAEVQDQGLASMRKFTDGIEAVLGRLESRVP